MNEHYVIIGCGPAGVSAAEWLRKQDHSARISILSKEPIPYYKKHNLIHYITGRLKRGDLLVKPYSFYKDNDLHLRLNQKVVSIDPVQKKLHLKHREEITYTKLLITCGANPFIPEYLDSSKTNIHFFHTMLQSIVLKKKIGPRTRIGMVCGDLMDYTAIRSLDASKLTVYLEGFWPIRVDTDDMKRIRLSMAKRKHMEVIPDKVSKVDRDHRAFTVRTDKGTVRKVDIFCGSFGLKPDLDFLLSSGIEFEKGILVNEFMKTNIDDIYAAGDCAQIYNPRSKDYWLSLGWKNAVHSGRTAAKNILGMKTPAKIGGNARFEIEGRMYPTNLWEPLT